MADAQLDFIIQDLAEFTRGETIALALEVDATLKAEPPTGTPIDTGWASANWVPSVGEPRIFAPAPGKPTASGVAAMQGVGERGLNSVLNWHPEDGALFNTNNVPYIQALNDGHSPQSQPGFVQAGLDRAVRQTYVGARARRQRQERGNAAKAAKRRPKK